MTTLDLNGANVTLPDSTFFNSDSYLNGTDNITNNGANDATLSEGGGGSGNIYSGTITNGSTHKTAITQTSGYVDITGSSTYSGGTNLQGGTIGVGTSTALGTGTLAMSAGTTLQDANASIVVELANNISLSGTDTIDNAGGVFGIDGVISGTGSLIMIGASELTLTAANTYSGGTYLEVGALAVDNSMALGTGTLSMANGTLVDTPRMEETVANNISLVSGLGAFDTNNMTLSGTISGAGGFEVFNSFGFNTLTVTGSNTYSGPTYIDSGAFLIVGNSRALGTGTLNYNGGGTLEAGASGLSLNNNVLLSGSDTIDTSGDTLTLSGVISGSGSLTKIGAGTLDLSGANTYSGGTTLNDGTLELGSGGSIAGNMQFAGSTATLQFDNSSSQLGGEITGAVVGDTIDIAFLAYKSSYFTVWSASGTLTVKDSANNNAVVANFTFAGSYQPSQFVLGNDAGATSITLQAATAAAATTVMIMDHSGTYEIYDIGQNAILAADPLTQISTQFQVAGLDDFSSIAGETADMMMRNTTSGAFTAYDVSNNSITGVHSMGQVGLEWQVAGFANFAGNANETDMLMRNSSTGAFQLYDISNNNYSGFHSLGQVGLEWQVAGFGDFSGNSGEADMLMRNSNTGAFELYDIANNNYVGFHSMGQVGLEWSVVGFGDFSGNANETDMLMRNSSGAFEIFDISNNNYSGFHSLGQVGMEWQVAGFGDFSGNANETDMLLRNTNTGAFGLYDIASNQLTAYHSMGQVGPEWTVAGIGTEPPITSGSSNAQLVQAMASFASGGAADSSPATVIGTTETTQQSLLTPPQAV